MNSLQVDNQTRTALASPFDGTVAEVWQQARPELDTSVMEIFGRLKHAHALHDLAMERVYEGAPLSPAESDVLVLLRHAGQPRVAGQLARQRGCSRAAISRIIIKLDQRGLITREPNPADRRAALIRITAEGSRLVDTLFPEQLALEAGLLARLDTRERQAVVNALNLLIDTLT
ncbi:MarR family winged helix-turn-helix transcriptional regulator [Streptomyces justiciae]|uniref:MarR family winged helix-turn-helix transcriptional regulator n=1 Tax=Streptomyces justiciae TaxID=2780140 RepID=UPI002118F4A1|nr:MarR family winged helix-turn-helix transcriptional regulator [Streptomyces justiciae]MCW8379739.1 MarR family winged helix-turn-helix transcriptional regulator [Streptomyces justiciae]